jgi:hypothetical protein
MPDFKTTRHETYLGAPSDSWTLSQSVRNPHELAGTLLSVLTSPSARKELAMSLVFHINEPCPKCKKPMAHADIERHPTRDDLAVRSFYCADCGPVKTQIISLESGKPPPEPTTSQ